MKFLKPQDGFTCVEILIGLFLLNFFICSLIKLELFNIRISYKSYFQTVAIMQAKNLIALLKVQKNMGKEIPMLLNQWQRNTEELLPHAKNNYECDSFQCDVTIEWQFKNIQKVHITEKI